VRSVNETCIIVDTDNNGYLDDLQYMALKMTLIEGKGEFNTGGAKKFSHHAFFNLRNNLIDRFI